MKRILLLLLSIAMSLKGCHAAPPPTDTLPTPGTSVITEAVTDDRESPEEGASPEDGIWDPDDPALPPDKTHTDTDSDGTCDDCGISVVILLDIFSVNDLHGKICDTDTQPGVDELTAYLKNAAATEEHTLLLSAGDMWQGSSESNLTRGALVTEWMNHLDFVSMTLGNHEYDWGEDAIRENAALAEFPFLAINVYDRDTNQRVDYCRSSVLVQRGGARIGVIGAIGDCYSSISGEMSGGIYFQVGAALTALVKAEAQKLRDAGADFIIYAVHDGHGSSSSGVGYVSDSDLASYYAPVLSEDCVDLVFEGHTHQRYVLRDGDGVYHLQGGGENRAITHAEAEINFAGGESRVRTAELIPSSVYSAAAVSDPIVELLLERYAEYLEGANTVLGYNSRTRSSDELRRTVASLYLRAGMEAFGEEYDIFLGGGFLSVRSPYDLPPGDVTYSQLQMLMPFDNTLVLCSVKGSDLISRFLQTTNQNYFIHLSRYGEEQQGSIDPRGTYYILVDTYTSTYAPNRLTEIARYTEGVYARDLLADFIKDDGFGRRGE